MLGSARLDAEFAQTLAGDVVSHPNEDVRRSAAYVLARKVDDPGVRDVLDRALSQNPSPEVRQRLNAVLLGERP